MFSIRLLAVGKSKSGSVQLLEREYVKRLGAFCAFQIEIINLSDAETEGAGILRRTKAEDFLVALDERGAEYTSDEFAAFVEKQKNRGRKIVFVIGGAYGLSESVKKRADAIVSLSKMTFPHQLVRIVFLEQLYRAFTIQHGMEYHH